MKVYGIVPITAAAIAFALCAVVIVYLVRHPCTRTAPSLCYECTMWTLIDVGGGAFVNTCVRYDDEPCTVCVERK